MVGLCWAQRLFDLLAGAGYGQKEEIPAGPRERAVNDLAEERGFYSLPKLPYGYGDLAPFVSEQLLKVHHDGHHQKYVNQANALLEKFDKARAEGTMLNMKCETQSLAFNVAGCTSTPCTGRT
jgi:hypothetical protein